MKFVNEMSGLLSLDITSISRALALMMDHDKFVICSDQPESSYHSEERCTILIRQKDFIILREISLQDGPSLKKLRLNKSLLIFEQPEKFVVIYLCSI